MEDQEKKPKPSEDAAAMQTDQDELSAETSRGHTLASKGAHDGNSLIDDIKKLRDKLRNNDKLRNK